MQKVCFKNAIKIGFFEGCLFFKIKNGSLIADFETPKNAFLETNSVLKGLKPQFFSAGNGVLKNARFCALFFLGGGGGNTHWEKIVPTIQS